MSHTDDKLATLLALSTYDDLLALCEDHFNEGTCPGILGGII